jgi:hypothetical protein
MSQKDLILSLHKESLTAKAIHERLVEIFGPLAMPHSTITKTFRETCWIPFEEGSQNFGGSPLNIGCKKSNRPPPYLAQYPNYHNVIIIT